MHINTTNLVDTILWILTVLGLACPFIKKELKLSKAKTKNERLKVLENYALRVVEAVEQLSQYAPSEKKAIAMQKLRSYLDECSLDFEVSNEQASDLIESAVNRTKRVQANESVEEAPVESVSTGEVTTEDFAVHPDDLVLETKETPETTD